MSFQLNGNVWDLNATVQAGAPVVYTLPNRGAPMSIHVQPGAGATASVQFCICSREALRAGDAIWLDWPHGTVASAAGIESESPTTALRIASTGGATQVQIAQGAR